MKRTKSLRMSRKVAETTDIAHHLHGTTDVGAGLHPGLLTGALTGTVADPRSEEVDQDLLIEGGLQGLTGIVIMNVTRDTTTTIVIDQHPTLHAVVEGPGVVQGLFLPGTDRADLSRRGKERGTRREKEITKGSGKGSGIG